MEITNPLSQHATVRMAQRGVSAQDLAVVIRHGLRIEQNGARLYFLGHRHVPSSFSPARKEHLEGIAAVVARSGDVVTVFRRKHLPRKLRRR